MSRIERIVLCTYWPFAKRDVQRFGLQLLRENGYEVEVWDFAPALHPEALTRAVRSDLAEDPGITAICDMAQGLAQIDTLPRNTFVILVNLLGYPLKAVGVCRALSKRRIRYGVCHGAPFPSDGIRLTWWEMAQRMARMTPTAFFRALALRCPARLLGIRPAKLLFVAGKGASYPTFPTGRSTDVISIHSFDYDLCLQERRRPGPPSERMAVFLDEYLPFHQDFAITGVTPPYSADEYYPMLCRFFDRLEKELGLEAVVAAHPKSHYEEHPDWYCGRRVVRDKTIQLVRAAQAVVSFRSTAVSFAVMYRKPIILLTTDRFQAMDVPRRDIASLSQSLGKEPLNISEGFDHELRDQLVVDDRKYEEYQRMYIKAPGTPEAPFWQVVADRVGALGD